MVNVFPLQPLLFTFASFLSDSTNFLLLSWMAQNKHKSPSLENYFSMSSFQIAPLSQLDEFLNGFQTP